MKSFVINPPASLPVDKKTAARIKQFNTAIIAVEKAEANVDALAAQARSPDLPGSDVVAMANTVKAARIDQLRLTLLTLVDGKVLIQDILAIAQKAEQEAVDRVLAVIADAGKKLLAAGWVPTGRRDLASVNHGAYQRALDAQASLAPEVEAAKVPAGELKAYVAWLKDAYREMARMQVDADNRVALALNAALR